MQQKKEDTAMVQATNSLTRRRLLQLLAGTVAGATGLPFAAHTPTAAASRWQVATRHMSHATSASVCQQTTQELLNLAATIEAMSVTFYYTAVATTDGFFGNLPTVFQRYLRVLLDEEAFHYRYLVDDRGAATATSFYFPTNVFAAGHFADFLATMDMLERAIVAMYLAAVRQMGEQDEPLRAAILGQIAGIEAEHRVIGREMAQNSPPAPNNLCYERADFSCATEVILMLASFLNGGGGFSGPVIVPDEDAIASAVGAFTCDNVPVATLATCDESLPEIINAAAQAEAIGIALYYHGIKGSFFAQLHEPQQWYLQAALDEERHHLQFLLDNGATPPATQFFFPPGVFDDLPQFLALLDTLENIFIGAYLAAVQRLNQLGEPLLAEIAVQILGVESEHRVLGRVLDAQRLPHNRCLAQANYTCLAQALADLAPFLEGSAEFSARFNLPTSTEINLAVDAFGCIPAPPATLPDPVYVPWVANS